jgi:hypothetical protein
MRTTVRVDVARFHAATIAPNRQQRKPLFLALLSRVSLLLLFAVKL